MKEYRGKNSAEFVEMEIAAIQYTRTNICNGQTLTATRTSTIVALE